MKGSSAPIVNTRQGKRPWMLDLRYISGKREFFENEGEAIRRRAEILKTVRVNGNTALALPYSKLVEFVAAEKQLSELGLKLADAVAFCRSHHAVSESIKFSVAIERFHLMKSRAKKDAEYVRKLKATLTALMENCGDRLLSTVSRSDIEDWLYAASWKPDTIRSHRINVRTFFNYAQKVHWIASNPASALEPVERTNKPPGILTVPECERLLKLCPRYFRAYVVLNLLCGIRPEECVKLLPENIQVKRGYVEVPAFRGDVAIAKSRKRRLVELSNNAKAWFHKCDLNLTLHTEKWFARQLPHIRKAANLNHWPKNCLRHSFASYHLAMHGSADKTAMQMGHRSTDILFAHYRELVTKEDAQKFWNIFPVK